MNTLTAGAPLPNALVFILLLLALVVLSLITHMQQYRTTYGLVIHVHPGLRGFFSDSK